MKKSELKNIIKECVKEVIFEEGALSTIISEVVQGLGASTLMENKSPSSSQAKAPSRASSELRQQVMKEVGHRSYEEIKKRFPNPELFEGTTPIPSTGKKGSALAGQAPDDAGVDISSIPGFGAWGNVVNNLK